MTQRERDRLVVLKKAQKKLITQVQAAGELGVSERQVRRLLGKVREQGDRGVIHGLRGRASKRKVSEEEREKAVRILSQARVAGLRTDSGRGVPAEEARSQGRPGGVAPDHDGGRVWRSRRQKVEQIHQWRQRRSARGELVQWDTSDHDWLEGRGPRLYLIHMIDDATSELMAKFVISDSTAENQRLEWKYLEQNGRPLAFYTDKASHFQVAPKTSRRLSLVERDQKNLPPTQIGRGLRELGIAWIPAHSPQAKRACRTQLCDGTGPAGERPAHRRRMHSGGGQPLSGRRVCAVVESASDGGACEPDRCPPAAGGRSTIWPRH